MNEPTPNIQQILDDAGLFSQYLERRDMLTQIVRFVRSQSNMDKDTMTYRLAMTIYHSKTLTGQSLISALEDPAAIYLRISKNPQFKAILDEMVKTYRTIPVAEVVKTLMCFILAAYVVSITP